MPIFNPIRILDNGFSRLIQFVGLIGKDGGKATVTDGGLDVNLQDQTTDAVISLFNQVHDSTTLTVVPILNSYTIEVADNTGITLGSYIIIFDTISYKFMHADALEINGNIITIDSPIDYEYPAGTFVDIATTNMNIDGSITPQIFGLRGAGDETIDLTIDITRIIIACETDKAVDLNKFGDLPELTKGVVLRSRNGGIKNIINVKSNAQIAAVTYDFTTFEASNPSQAVDGFISMLTLAGQHELGVAIRLGPGEDLEVWIQDDLTGLVLFSMVAEGHIVK